MSISKREGSPFYWYDFTVNGSRFRGSTETNDKALAQAKEAALRKQAWMEIQLGVKPRLLLNAAMALFWRDYAQYLKTGESSRKYQIRHVLRILGKSTPFEQINDAMLARYVATRRKERVSHNNKSQRKVSNATVNHELHLIQSAYNRIKLWGYEVSPDANFRIHRLPEPKHRTRWLTAREVEAVIAKMPYRYQKQMVRFVLYTGVRKSNACSIDKSDIDLKSRMITFTGVKSRKPEGEQYTVPIVDGLYEMLTKEMGMKPGDKGPLFARKKGKLAGTPFKDFRKGFKTACQKAGVTNVRGPHDLRHTCASWLVQRGVPVHLVKEILGHREIKTTLKYTHLAGDERARAMELLTSQMRHTGTKKAVKKKTAKVKKRKAA